MAHAHFNFSARPVNLAFCVFSFDNCDYLHGSEKICAVISGNQKIAIGLKRTAGISLIVICCRIHDLPCQNVMFEASFVILLIEKLARVSRRAFLS